MQEYDGFHRLICFWCTFVGWCTGWCTWSFFEEYILKLPCIKPGSSALGLSCIKPGSSAQERESLYYLILHAKFSKAILSFKQKVSENKITSQIKINKLSFLWGWQTRSQNRAENQVFFHYFSFFIITHCCACPSESSTLISLRIWVNKWRQRGMFLLRETRRPRVNSNLVESWWCEIWISPDLCQKLNWLWKPGNFLRILLPYLQQAWWLWHWI